METYDIRLIRDETGIWVGRCEEAHATTQALTIRGALAGIREAISLADDVEEDDIRFRRIDLEFGGFDGSALLTQALAAREELAAAEARSRDLTRRVVREFSEAGVTRRDVGVLLGISGQRVDQLLGS
jgi:predicted RNase H-like HicB family nuclease